MKTLPKADKYLMRLYAFMFLFFLSLTGAAESLRDRVLSSGPHSGKKLTEVISAYRIPGQSGEAAKIPAKSVTDAIRFFDSYAPTSRRFQQRVITPVPGGPSVFEDTLETKEGPTLGNQKYIAIFDLNQHASKKRLHIINIENGETFSIEASHGRDTDCGGDRLGWACDFISDRDSDGTPLGFFAAGSMFNGHHGPSLRMNGLEGNISQCSKNADGTFRSCPGNVLPTTIIIHSADYVMEGHAGRSKGCVAVSNDNISRVREKLKDGALFYFFHDSLGTELRAPVSGLTESNTVNSDD